MKKTLEDCPERHRQRAMIELVAELKEFSYDGLTLLRDDLVAGRVIRGSWAGCVLSYKRGAAGSTRRDRLGRARNALTVLWDGGWFTDEEVLSAVRHELVRRGVKTAPGPPAQATPEAPRPPVRAGAEAG